MLVPGTRLGAFEIGPLLGVGGMGEVYRARDARLGRDVAIKVLPAILAMDPERRARFEREARVLATINHPNIASIHGVEEHEGVWALVLELVEGETLADRVLRGPVPPAEVARLAAQLIDALDAAHERGIVHRDLKPANVKLTDDGVIKVLDFGLAKAMAEPGAVSDPTHSPTVTSGGTREGVILGTAAYMRPEQARGRAVDKRADIWAWSPAPIQPRAQCGRRVTTRSRISRRNRARGHLFVWSTRTDARWSRHCRRDRDRPISRDRSMPPSSRGPRTAGGSPYRRPGLSGLSTRRTRIRTGGFSSFPRPRTRGA